MSTKLRKTAKRSLKKQYFVSFERPLAPGFFNETIQHEVYSMPRSYNKVNIQINNELKIYLIR